nr:2747_t:CDS:2 [Entrophospora candida]
MIQKTSTGQIILVFIVLFFVIATTEAGPLAYGCCQTACNLAWVSCYAASGLTAGKLTGGAALPEAALACNVCQGVCMTVCASCFLAPTP